MSNEEGVAGSERQRSFWQTFLAGAEESARRWGGTALFAFGLAVYLGVQTAFVLTPILRRATPIEPDDAYCYIVKAEEMRSCFRQDCPALNDLRPQLTSVSSVEPALPVGNDQAAFERFRQYHRLLSFYSPFHAALLNGLRIAGLSWEAAYNALQIGGLVFIGLAVGAWLCALWGTAAAGFAMLLLAVNVFAGHGLHLAVPGNLTLGFALLTWAVILRSPKPSSALVLAGIAAMLAMHPAGRLYSLIAIVLCWFLAGRPRSRRLWAVVIIGLLLIAIASALPWIVTRPELSLIRDPSPQGWSRLRAIPTNVAACLAKATLWIGLDRRNVTLAGLIVADLAFLLVAGFLTVCAERRRKIAVMGVLLFPLLFVDFALPHPHYPGESFTRLWVPFAVLLTGAIGQVAVTCLALSFDWLRRVVAGGMNDSPSREDAFSKDGWRLVLLALMLIILCRYTLNSVESKIGRMRYAQQGMLTQGDIVFASRQPTLLLSLARKDDRVLYTHETTMYYFLIHGGLDFGAVYYPAIRGTPDEQTWLAPDKNISFLAGINPYCAIPLRTANGLALRRGEKIEVRSESPLPLAAVRLRLVNPGNEARLAIHVLDLPASDKATTSIELLVPPKSDGWLPAAPKTDFRSSRFAIEMLERTAVTCLAGIRMQDNSPLNWPWDQGISLAYSPGDGDRNVTVVSFSSRDLCPALKRPLQILADDGSSVLAKVGQSHD